MLIGHDWGAIATNALGAHPDSPLRLAPRQLRLSWYTLFNQLPSLPERTVDRWLPTLWCEWSPGYDTARFELVERAGHFLQVERPGVVNELIADFLSQRQ
ncbi:hypothetical protein [uncultured Nocardioides sp.]|uniref:alpha/beta fold hydrolase n=1 Tax=uncultured Nocardioides sp. TaxID=198441 RepID=UPI002620C893|nr:hypothetical protein [uncultured Nocardioides sp.]